MKNVVLYFIAMMLVISSLYSQSDEKHKQVQNFSEKYFKYIRNQAESDSEAAKKLGLAPPNYYRMCKELGLK